MKCKQCVYFESDDVDGKEIEGYESGMCHRHPQFVYVVKGYWCGEGMTESEYVAKKRSTLVGEKL